jgi:hypothetical protein
MAVLPDKARDAVDAETPEAMATSLNVAARAPVFLRGAVEGIRHLVNF